MSEPGEPGESYDLPSVDSITVGTVGQPGQRIFYLQARAASTVVTVKLEKQQVAVLAAALREMLGDLPAPQAAPGAPELLQPLRPIWAAGTMGLSTFDDTTRRVTLLLTELVVRAGRPDDDDEEDDDDEAQLIEGAAVRVGLTIEQMIALAERGEDLVESGRPNCALCGNPMDPNGHACPKTNGHLRH